MTKQLDIPPELLEPKLLDGKQQELIEDYMRLIVKKMDEWTSNIMRTQTSDFAARNEPPEEDADGMYNLADAVIMFQSALLCFSEETAAHADSNSGQPASGFGRRFGSRDDPSQSGRGDGAQHEGDTGELVQAAGLRIQEAGGKATRRAGGRTGGVCHGAGQQSGQVCRLC